MNKEKSKPKNEEKKNQFKLLFVGQQLYNTEIFENEAKRLGVNRAIAFSHLAGLKWGDPILLARYIPKYEHSQSQNAESKMTVKKIGSAEIFGYFTINGLSHNLPSELSQELQKELHIVKVDDKHHGVSRACGSYNIGAIAYISDTLEELVDKLKKLVGTDKEFGVNSYKWFLTGKYTSLQHFILDPITFSRGLQSVTVENLNLSLQQNEPASLVWIYSYKRRGYMNKLMKQRFQQASKSKLMDLFK
jgi:hypothetical protein